MGGLLASLKETSLVAKLVPRMANLRAAWKALRRD